MQAVLDAVVEPRRREILRLVRTRESSAGSIAAHFPDVSRPTVSQHLRVLRDDGLLHERRDGTRRLYRVRVEGFTEVRTFFDEFWDSRLQALKAEAEREQRRQDAHREKRQRNEHEHREKRQRNEHQHREKRQRNEHQHREKRQRNEHQD